MPRIACGSVPEDRPDKGLDRKLQLNMDIAQVARLAAVLPQMPAVQMVASPAPPDSPARLDANLGAFWVFVFLGCTEVAVYVALDVLGEEPRIDTHQAWLFVSWTIVACARIFPLVFAGILACAHLSASSEIVAFVSQIIESLVCSLALGLRLGLMFVWWALLVCSLTHSMEEHVEPQMVVLIEFFQCSADMLLVAGSLLGCVGRDEEPVSALGIVSYETTKVGKAIGREVESTCVICIGTLEEGDEAATLLCGHTFHKACIDPWLRKHASCPFRCPQAVSAATRRKPSAHVFRADLDPSQTRV